MERRGLLIDCSNKITLMYLAVSKMLLTRYTIKGKKLFIGKGQCVFPLLVLLCTQDEMTVHTSHYSSCQALELKCCDSRDLEKQLVASSAIPIQPFRIGVSTFRPLTAISPMHSPAFICLLCKWRAGGA